MSVLAGIEKEYTFGSSFSDGILFLPRILHLVSPAIVAFEDFFWI